MHWVKLGGSGIIHCRAQLNIINVYWQRVPGSGQALSCIQHKANLLMMQVTLPTQQVNLQCVCVLTGRNAEAKLERRCGLVLLSICGTSGMCKVQSLILNSGDVQALRSWRTSGNTFQLYTIASLFRGCVWLNMQPIRMSVFKNRCNLSTRAGSTMVELPGVREQRCVT